jgi:hypothetical protein
MNKQEYWIQFFLKADPSKGRNHPYFAIIEQIQLDAMKEGARKAAAIANDYDGSGMYSRGYYDQLGDARETQLDIYKSILSAIESWSEKDLH